MTQPTPTPGEAVRIATDRARQVREAARAAAAELARERGTSTTPDMVAEAEEALSRPPE